MVYKAPDSSLLLVKKSLTITSHCTEDTMNSQPKLMSELIISSDGSTIYAEAIGNHTGQHIIFLHGFTLSSAVFDNIFFDTRYHKEYFLVSITETLIHAAVAYVHLLQIRYDLRGHGRSEKPNTKDGYTSKLFAEDFWSVMRLFRLSRPILVGWLVSPNP